MWAHPDQRSIATNRASDVLDMDDNLMGLHGRTEPESFPWLALAAFYISEASGYEAIGSALVPKKVRIMGDGPRGLGTPKTDKAVPRWPGNGFELAATAGPSRSRGSDAVYTELLDVRLPDFVTQPGWTVCRCCDLLTPALEVVDTVCAALTKGNGRVAT